MDYKNQYNKLVTRAKSRSISGYKETHHILPRSMGGTDEPQNLVELTAREHFIAHLLLLKIYPNNYSLIKAVNMMCMGHKQHRSMNRMYGWLREKFSNEMSRSQSGFGNSQYGKKWIFNLELKQNRKILISEQIPEGWSLGRILDFDLYFDKLRKKEERKSIIQNSISEKQKKLKENKQLKETKKIEYEKYILSLYELYKQGNYYSISEFHKVNNLQISRMTISNYWRKHIPEYRENSKEGKRFRF